MACNLPMAAYQLSGGGTAIGGHHPDKPGYPIRIKCGKCTGCRMNKAREWALRCALEMQEHKTAAFITLTYDEEHVPLTLRPRDLELWLKRFRKFVGAKRPIRYFACGEYGERTKRPHYHALLYGASEEDRLTVDRTWRMGRTQCEAVTPARIAYVAGYTQKKIKDRYQQMQGVTDNETGEWVEYQPPFIRMSRNPGLGRAARDKYPESWRDYAVHNGHRMPVPKYLHEGWRATVTPEEIEQNKLLRNLKAIEHKQTLEMLAANEQISIARQDLNAARRKG